MRTSTMSKVVALQILAVAVVANAQAASGPGLVWGDGGSLDTQNETIYRPTCWPGESSEPWPRCAVHDAEGTWHSSLDPTRLP